MLHVYEGLNLYGHLLKTDAAVPFVWGHIKNAPLDFGGQYPMQLFHIISQYIPSTHKKFYDVHEGGKAPLKKIEGSSGFSEEM